MRVRPVAHTAPVLSSRLLALVVHLDQSIVGGGATFEKVKTGRAQSSCRHAKAEDDSGQNGQGRQFLRGGALGGVKKEIAKLIQRASIV